MKSLALPSFWKSYKKLAGEIKPNVKKAFHLWKENPFHPSLHFKCVHADENIWSLRVNRNFRALCYFEEENVTWFWIGNHDDYIRFLKKGL